ncbi:MAG TPA: GFA family protein [Stellaceae bacterium]|nr:GFA family protein [Stellaceae bacterium]
MGETRTERHGRCHCGAIRFTATGAPLFVVLCHCESCRRSTGGALAAACGFRREDVAFAGNNPTYYDSSPGVRRGFCPRCGTSLTFESTRWPDDVHLMVGNFDSPDDFTPQCHVFAGERLPWLKMADGLPCYRTVPSAGDLIEPETASAASIRRS